ncbi:MULTISPECIES: hypothetical protein [Streptomyces]|uniref:Uncharacterized protein n=1 Tax=Streptomyces stelliscabiei TaxID=146820 RepID=A0A8I0P0U5_9ACTN|nr:MULTISPECIES: hypothetical protein [Streptomyces]MBE1594226.1 hypothetical protein [Streptomyces stelliscabiei]MDX2521172.1 hypothetical protein [Streptomyces stelliscabiei]MDX2836322.1 hypothetical protein [Streptomyces scabiei]MDX3276160.1 hypothetical protein [Streptomyces scabiei]MDX3681133.1 hypothetical protein [Streptomyces scabiei]
MKQTEDGRDILVTTLDNRDLIPTGWCVVRRRAGRGDTRVP